ncbi:MAG: class IV adenylate cyclase [Polaromonas sp.]|nr:class IV adenylate cyclase [Gemmatimonadaceae bacterium]
MLEVELKSVVDDLARRRAAIESAGATLVFDGRLEDRRYDSPDRALTARDHVLRVRVYRDAAGTRAQLDFKGPTQRDDGYKVREELESHVSDADALVAILDRLGYVVTIAIDRDIVQYELGGAMIRFERYPRMDDLVEVEGARDAIEQAIAALGMPRAGFLTDRLPDFTRRFEERTGARAAVSRAALAGDERYDMSNA